MNLGSEREKIGDILVDGSSAYIFVLSDMAETVARELTRVKHTSVDCGLVSPSECDVQPKFTEVSGSVASQRVDAVLAMVWHLSRGRSQEIIKAENVFINGQTVNDPGYNLKSGDRVTVRGHGKFIYEGMGTMTKKGRFYANVRVYS
jgi:RNA-binding protein YlmH